MTSMHYDLNLGNVRRREESHVALETPEDLWHNQPAASGLTPSMVTINGLRDGRLARPDFLPILRRALEGHARVWRSFQQQGIAHFQAPAPRAGIVSALGLNYFPWREINEGVLNTQPESEPQNVDGGIQGTDSLGYDAKAKGGSIARHPRLRYRRAIEDILDIERARTRFEIKSPIAKTKPYPIGTGSRGDVFEASMDGHRVVVKVMRGREDELLKLKKFILREVVVWYGLKHDNVAPFYGLTYDTVFGRVPGMVSPFIEHDLMTFTSNAKHPQARSRLIYETAQGIQYLHSQLVIHGDVSIDNVRVSQDGHAKIIDFGMGKLLHVRGFTSIWTPNPRYFAPELLMSEDGVRPTFKSDVYSFGMLVLQVTHGRDRQSTSDQDMSMPFNECRNTFTAQMALCSEVVGGRRPRQDKYRNVTPNLWELLERCWRHDFMERPSMTEVLRDLPRA